MYIYEDFCYLFMRYYQSDDVTYAKLAWLKSSPYNLRLDGNLENLVTSRYNSIKDLDMQISETQICNILVTLMPAAAPKVFVVLFGLTLIKVMETVRKFETIPKETQERTLYSLRRGSQELSRRESSKSASVKIVEAQYVVGSDSQ